MRARGGGIQFILQMACWAVIAWAAALPVFAADAPRPNIVIILCDDLGYGDLGCYGHPQIRTPHLDRLASQGVRFTDCYAAAPVCSSSRAGLMTGRNPTRIGVYDWIPEGHPIHLKASEITIARLLKDAGYATCHVGKWHLNGKFNDPAQPQPGEHGFEHWFSTQNNAAPTHQNPINFVKNGEKVGPIEGYSCQIVADEAIRWLSDTRQKSADKPFFLSVCFHEPHEPVASPPELLAEYPQAKENEGQYFANVTNMDRAVGRLLEKLDELKVADNTFVFFTSDNGPETLDRYKNATRSYGSPGPLRGMKLHIYDGGIRVPGILRWPGKAKPGETSAVPICSVDLLPTLCAIAGAALPADRKLDGTNLLPLFAGQPLDRRTPLFWHYYRSLSEPKAALRAGDWKIVGHWDGPAKPVGGNVSMQSQAILKKAQLVRFELYKLTDDIGEKHDLAASEPAKLAELKTALEAIYREILTEAPEWEGLPDK